MNKFYTRINMELDELKKAGKYKSLLHNQNALDGTMQVENLGEQIVLCSNNYVGLANDPAVIEAAHGALEKYGAGASSVRFICGTYDIHRDLEQKTAQFLGMEEAITYTSCWAANTAAIPALLQAGDAVISDELNHASIIDGCRAVSKGVTRQVYKHADMTDLEEKLKACADCETVLVVTDGVFSMEGNVAPLPDIVHLCKQYGALVMVDDSHATGVIGRTGRGTMEHFGMTSGVDIISGTYGKALGGAGGGFIAASADVCDILVQRSRPHLFSNALPPVLCAIALAAIETLEREPERVQNLREKTAFVRKKLLDAGLNPLEGDSAIVPLIVGDTAKAISMANNMRKQGVYTIGFGFPVVPEGTARVRLQISSALTDEQLARAVDVIIAEALEQLS